MMREQEEAARNGFKSPRFFSSAGKIGFERKKKVPRRVRGENERQIRVRGKRTKAETHRIPARRITSVSSVIQRAPM